MERFKISEVLPLNLYLPFIIILAIELLFYYGLDFYNQKQLQSIQDKKAEIEKKENEIFNKIKNNEAYFIFSQYANSAYLAENRISLNTLIEKFNTAMPKSLIVKSFAYDKKEKSISLNLAFRSWDDYLKFRSYLEKNPKFIIDKESYPRYDEKENLLTFSLTLKLTSQFFK